MQIFFAEDKGCRELHLDAFCCFSLGEKTFFILVDGFGDSSPNSIFRSVRKIADSIVESNAGDISCLGLDELLDQGAKMSFMGVVFDDCSVEIFSAGDCRIYSDGELISTDDTVAWKALIRRNSHKDTAVKSMCHPMRNSLTNCLSSEKEASLRKIRFGLHGKRKFLLCTDGVWSLFHKKIIAEEFSLSMIHGNLSDNGLAIEISL